MAAHHNHEPSQLDLYEGDQSKLYSGVLAHHEGGIESADSRQKIKKIWKVTGLLSIITIIEVAIGLAAFYNDFHGNVVIGIFLLLTMIKAAYITMIFMHLGDEVKAFQWFVLFPLVLLIWVIIAYLLDAIHWMEMNFTFGHTIVDLLK